MTASRASSPGITGPSEDDYAEPAQVAEQQRAVLEVGNFVLTVVLLQKFADLAARLIPPWEIIDHVRAARPGQEAVGF